MPQTNSRLTKPEIASIQAALINDDLAAIKRAYKANRFADSRLTADYLSVLDKARGYCNPNCIANFVAEYIIPTLGLRNYEEILRATNLGGNQSNAVRLGLLHRLNRNKTKPLLLEALKKGTYQVKLAAIDCLGDHADSFELLVKYSRKYDYEVIATKSISRLGTPESREFMIQMLEAGKYHVLKHSADKIIRDLIYQKAENCLEQIVTDKSKARRNALIEEFGILIRACEDASARFDRLLLNCLKHVSCFKSGSRNRYPDTFAEICKFVGLRKKSIALHLIDVRDEIPAEDFSVVADVGRKYLSPSEFFGLFAKYSNPRAKRSSAEGKRDGELFASLSRELSKMWCHVEFQAGRKEKSKLDPRWADLAFEKHDDDLILELANLKHPRLEDYLTDIFTANANKDPFQLFPIIEAMVRSKHPDARRKYLCTIERKAFGRKFDPDYQRWLYLLKDLPKSMTKRVLELSENAKCNQEARTQIPRWLSMPYDEFFGPAAASVF